MRIKPNWVITILLTVIYMAIVGAVWAVNDVNYKTVGDTTDNILAGIVVPVGLGAIFLAVAASVLGWWRPALREVPRVGPRWLLLIPAIYVVAALSGLLSVDFARVEGKYLLYLAVGTLLVGFSEEMLCRGLGLVGLRGSLPEVWVWFFSCLIFVRSTRSTSHSVPRSTSPWRRSGWPCWPAPSSTSCAATRARWCGPCFCTPSGTSTR